MWPARLLITMLNIKDLDCCKISPRELILHVETFACEGGTVTKYDLCLFVCSAGVGRTGTLITIQSMMKMIEHERKVDIFNFVLAMRHQRNLMAQTEVNVMNVIPCKVQC